MELIDNEKNLRENFEKLKTAVLLKRPVLNDILHTHGSESLFDYMKGYVARRYRPINPERQAELIETVREEVSVRLGATVADDVAKQLHEYFYVSTTDHYGPLYHPWVFNFNLVASDVCRADPNPVLKNIITFACANVSLNNFSFPRGFAFSSDVTGKNKLNRFSFLPSNSHAYPVYGFRSYKEEEIKKVKNSLREAVQKQNIRPTESQATENILSEVYSASEVVAEKYFSDQVTKTNYALWKKIVPNEGKNINFVYLEQEWITARLLIKHHLQSKTTISRIIYDDRSEELLLRYFVGLPEAFSRRERLGTYLFWAQPRGDKNGQRLRLWKEGNYLVSDDGKYKVELSPEALESALMSKELIPSVLLTFMVLCFYYGLKCLGGLGQINYLPRLKEAYVQMQNDIGHAESAIACQNTETDNLGGEVTVALVSSSQNGTAPATLFDFLVHNSPDAWKIVTAEAKKITLEEAIVPMFTEDYPIVYSQAERDPALFAITSKQITKLMGLDQKINPCVSM